MATIFFNAQHAPIGAFASFTLGMKGKHGGLGLQMGKPADENVFIGLESAKQPGLFQALPFYQPGKDAAVDFDVERDEAAVRKQRGSQLVPFDDAAITRDYRLASDTFTAGDLTFRILCSVRSLPDAEAAQPDHDALKLAVAPAVLVEIEVDNTACDHPRRVFFGYEGENPYAKMRAFDRLPAGSTLKGIANGLHTAIASDDPRVCATNGFTTSAALDAPPANRAFALGRVSLLVGEAPANQRSTFRFAVCFYAGGVVTSGEDAVYFYTRYFARIEDVAAFALANFDTYRVWADEADALLDAATHLSDAQKFHIAHAVHSYYASTQLLDLVDGTTPAALPLQHAGRMPWWVVNEGEYRMMNTFDLTADMLFYEMRFHPWTVRNELDAFIDRYLYTDMLHLPGGPNEHPGGISFTHDQGVANYIARRGYSTYEMQGLTGCFSHMTHEQLVNFICCAGIYLAQTQDTDWLQRRAATLEACLASLLHRDHPDPDQRNGVMGLDSSRTGDGAEITTYDSLDVSLGQARNNLYMAVKTWAAYLTLERLFDQLGKAGLSKQSREQAQRAAGSIASNALDDGQLPGVFEPGNPGQNARIIPAVEGLVFPYLSGRRDALASDGPYAALITALRRHIEAVLAPGICLFEDGGWKLSSTSNNSWLSKVYLCQFVYRQVLGLPWDARGHTADRAHARWLLRDENLYWAWSDQMISGVARGSKYYPRGVTSILWLTEAQ